MPIVRKLVPELLDHLLARDARAIRSRRDLKRVNVLMGNARSLAKVVLNDFKPPITRILDIGSGDGLFMLALARRLSFYLPPVCLTLVDRHDLVTTETCEDFEQLGWKVNRVCANIHPYLAGQGIQNFDLITANLFLHHFEGPPLSVLLRLISNLSPRFVACEPARTGMALAGSRLLGAIGCNEVSPHDAVASVIAGFGGRELSEQWPTKYGWTFQESDAGLFSHVFSALRER